MEQPTTLSGARRARLALVAAILLPLVFGWLVLGGGLERLRPGASGPAAAGDVGQPAPDFSLEDPTGRQVRLSDYRGRVVLVNFWATWCVPCRAEMPEIESTYRANRERGFQVLAVNIQESADEIRPFMAELELTFPAVLDYDGAVSRAYRARALPSSYLIDARGVVQYVRVGPLTKPMLEEQLRRLGF